MSYAIAKLLAPAVVLMAMHETGSRFTCDPPVMDTDEDWLVLVTDLDQATAILCSAGWTNCIEEWQEDQVTSDDPCAVNAHKYAVEDKYGARFCAFRDGQLNVIATDDVTFYLRSVGATLLAKQLNLRDKADRIALFRAIKYGEPYKGPFL